MKIRSTMQASKKMRFISRTGLRAVSGAAKLLVLAASALVTTGVQAANTLVDITHISLPGNKQQIALTMSGPASEPKSFTIENPARIALDLLDTTNDMETRNITIGSGTLSNITAVEAGGRTRVVINLTTLSPYSTEVRGNQLLVNVNPAGNEENYTEPQLAEPLLLAAQSTPVGGSILSDSLLTGSIAPQRMNMISGLDFRRGPMGEGRVIFKLSSAGVISDVRQEGGKLIVEFPGTELSNELQKRLDVMDFGTPVRFIDAISNKRGTRVVIVPANDNFEQLAYQSDNLFTVELKPMSKDEVEDSQKAKYGFVGEKLSLNFQDIEVRSVLQLLADFTDLNIVVSDSVEGKLTLRLKNVPWDQALEIILQSKSLAKRQSGSVIMIAPSVEVAESEKLEMEAAAQKAELAPLRTEFFQANYAKAKDLAELLKSDDVGTLEERRSSGILTDRGTVTVDVRTNTLLINDTVEQLKIIRELVNRLDVPIRQVLIESRIVIASDDFNKDIGVRWGINSNTANPGTDGGTGEGTILSGSSAGITSLFNGEDLGDGRYNVNLPGNNAAGSLGIALAKLPFGTLLELELSAMQAEGSGEVISSPRVITANQHKAYIEQGVEIPYLEASSSGAATVTFRKAILGLTVTPQITPDDKIIMDLQVNKDTVGEIFGAGEIQVPSIDTREVSTQVLVNNGETVVLGGVYEQSILNKVDMVPFFGNLPLIGRLFQHTVNTDDKSELLVFVTPKIVEENVSLNY